MQLAPALRTVILPVLVIALAVGTGWWATGRLAADTRSPLAVALDALPAGTVVAGFTDWSAIRAELGADDESAAAGRATLTDDAALRDLTTRSVLGSSIEEMHRAYGWSAADLDWEAYGQAAGGAALVARLSSSVTVDTVRRRLAALGYTRRGDTWTLGQGGTSSIGAELATTLGVVAVLPRERLVVAGPEGRYVRTVARTVRGARPSLLDRRPVVDLASTLSGSDSVLLQAREESCRATAVDVDDPDATAQARAAVARSGALATPSWTGRGLVEDSPDQTIRFALAFDSPTVAAGQATVRAALARGPFIGRSGLVEDSLDLEQASSERGVTSLRFTLDPDRGAFMAGEGTVLFASCP